MAIFLRHLNDLRRHIPHDQGGAGGGLRRRRHTESRSAADDPTAAAEPGPETPNELDIEKRWMLLARIDNEQFGLFFEKYHRPLLSYLQHRVGDRDVAEDLLSETFLHAIGNLGRFRFQGVTFGAFLFRLARHRAARYFERRKARQEQTFAIKEHDLAVPPEAVAAIEAEQDAQLVALCVRQLDEEAQDLVVLHYFQHLSQAQIAVIMGLSEENVKARLYRARGKLARLLESPHVRARLSREGRRALDQLRMDDARIRVIAGDKDGGRTP